MRSKLAIGVIIGVVIGISLSTVFVALAGDPGGPGTPPDGTFSYSLADIYHSLNSGTAATASAFTEPATGPGTGTMYTLDEIYGLTRERAQVPKTGQTTTYETGDDGDLERGVAWPDPRFTDNEDGTVTDNLTGLIWLEDANCFGLEPQDDALSYANTLNDGECGLSDGSAEGNWRLPNVRELHSLIDYGRSNPALPSGHPFTGVESTVPYWSSSIVDNLYGWRVSLGDGSVRTSLSANSMLVWPVRGGQ
jgi:hypothetical protein